MKKIITIDAGTSNLRIHIIENNKIIFSKKDNYGVKVGKDIFKKHLYLSLKQVLTQYNINNDEIECIIASGMISSSLGLIDIPHIETPVSKFILSKNINSVMLNEFCIHIIPGVKTKTKYFEPYSLNSIDVIRGEEVEIIGLLEKKHIKDKALVILPGSHNKFIEVNHGQITNIITSMSGEIYDAMTKHTLLSVSTQGEYINKINEKFLFLGVELGLNYGFTQACFLIRSLDIANTITKNSNANILLGIVLSQDLHIIRSNHLLDKYKEIVIAGGNLLADALFLLLSQKNNDNIKFLSCDNLATIGSLAIWKTYMENSI